MLDTDAFRRLLLARRSVRAFRPDAVSTDTLRRVFTTAQQAPSNCNVQPWVVHVVSCAQSLMLAMVAEGLGSCAQGVLVRRELGFGDDPRLLFGISFGYPDEDHAANTVRTDRAALDAATTFHG